MKLGTCTLRIPNRGIYVVFNYVSKDTRLVFGFSAATLALADFIAFTFTQEHTRFDWDNTIWKPTPSSRYPKPFRSPLVGEGIEVHTPRWYMHYKPVDLIDV